MNALMLFCAYMALVYVPWDFFFKPVSEDEEVWLGIVLRGTWAKATEPLHWAVYAAGAWGFLRMRTWMWPWAAVYTAQIAIAMLVWAVLSRGGLPGWALGVVSAAPFVALAVALYRARDRFRPAAPSV
jgi:hypothetical protein